MSAPECVEIGLHAGHDPPRAELGGLVGSHHLQVLQTVTTARDRGYAEVFDHAFQRGNDRLDGGITDHVETGRHAGLGACPQVRRDVVGVQVARTGVTRGVVVRLVQPRRARTQGAVDEQVTGQPGRTGVVEDRARLGRAAHRLAPVTDHLDPVGPGAQGPQFVPVLQPADFGAGAFVYRDDSIGGRGVQRGQPGFGPLAIGQQVTRDGADRMMGIADQRPLFIKPGRRRQSGHPLAQTGRRQRRVHIDPGQIGGPITQHRVQFCGGRCRVVRPRRFVPTVTPDRPAGMGRRIVGDQLQAVRARCRRPQIETGKRQPGRGEVDVAVDETRRDEAAVQIDDVGTGELASADVVAAQPDHDTVADCHRGGVRMGRAVNPAVDQQDYRDLSHAAKPTGWPLDYSRSRGDGRAGGSTSVTSMTSPSM